MSTFVLVHSPLVGPATWELVAYELRQCKIGVVVPALSTDVADKPYWKQHASAVAQALIGIQDSEPLVLVGHSGAGVLLPAIRQMISQPVGGYIFVDASIPRNGASRLDLFGSLEEVTQFRDAAQNGFLPVWSDDDLRNAIQDDSARRQFVNELQPLPLGVYEEPIPVFDGWPDAPCAYLLFSEVYRDAAMLAQSRGWHYAELLSGHFQMLNDPVKVADMLLELASKLPI
jgi:hypothetical protein